MKRQYIYYLLSLLVISFLRVFPHPTGCSPLIATSLFIVLTAPSKYKNLSLLFLPMFFLITSTLTSGLWQGWWIQPLSLFVVLLCSLNFKITGFTPSVLLGASSSLVFFFVSNTGAWIAHALPYSMDLKGWMNCMTMGIPYLKSQLLWDSLFTVLIFEFYRCLSFKRSPALI